MKSMMNEGTSLNEIAAAIGRINAGPGGRGGVLLLLTMLLSLSPLVRAQTPTPPTKAEEAPTFKFSGLVYGDYYYVAENHRDELESQNGFWIRRMYFTYDQVLSKSLSLRVRLEMNSKGDFQSTGVNTPYIKDLWLKWAFGPHSLTFGIIPTPNIDFIDAFQGYRSVEKSPFDLYKWDTSRDLGLQVQGAFGKEKRTRYSVQLANGSGLGSEVNPNKSVRGEILHSFASGLVLEGYADWQDGPGGRDVATLEAFAGCQKKTWRASLQYGHQERRQAGAGGADLSLDFLSAFAAVQVSPTVTVLGRLDRNFDAIPGGETIDYLPFSETAKSAFGLVGVDFTLHKNVHLIPNIELTAYDEMTGGTAPGTDLIPRVTLFFSW